MKYGVTSRSISLGFHALIAAAFGVMGLYFGFFIVPQYLGSNPTAWYDTNYFHFDTSGSFLLWFELAVLGLSFFVISTYGFVQALLSLSHPGDDTQIVKSFNAFFAEGYIAAIFMLLQAMLLWDLTANGNIALVIVMGLLAAVVLMIATNIPLLKVYDQRKYDELGVSMLAAASVVTFFMTLESVLGTIGTSTGYYQLYNLLTTMIVGSGATFALCLAATLVSKFAGNAKLANWLASGALLVSGACLGAFGILDIVYQYIPNSKSTICPVHLYFTGVGINTESNSFDLGFGIMAIVIGALLVIGSLVFAYINENKKTAEHAA